MNDIDEFKFKLKSKFFSWIIVDPYPEHTHYGSLSMSMKLSTTAPEYVSIHKAWRDGYEFAKALIEKELKDG